MRKTGSPIRFVESLALSLALMGLAFAFIRTDVGDEFRGRAVASLEFSLRTYFKQNPEISPRLKVVSYADRARKILGLQETLQLSAWTHLVETLASRKPQAIVFDKFFSGILATENEVQEFNAAIKQVEATVVAGVAFGNDDQNSFFEKNQFADWSLSDIIRTERKDVSTLIGPDKPIRHSFTKIAGIQLSNMTALEPGWIESQTGETLPTLGLSFAKQVLASRKMLRVDETALHLDRNGRIPVNFVERTVAWKSFIPAAALLVKGKDSVHLQKINKGDIVLVLPSMYTGSTDFKVSPVGRIEGGFYHMSLMNSVLGNNTLIPVLHDSVTLFLFMCLLSFISVFVCLRSKIKTGVFITVVGGILIALCGLTGFIWYSLLSDWHVFSAFFILNGGVILSTRAIREEQRAGLIESALQGMVSKEMLDALKKNPEVLYRRPRNLQLTVMFIDIEGFSLRTKDSISPDVFTLLHAQMDLMTEIIHAHGGIIDRILGDGLMCYFGFSPIEDEKIVRPSEHAYRALKCAIAIQREAARVTATANLAHGTLAGVVPLRIGINSGEVFLGNLGAGRRIDFTVVGNTVTKAKRLEDACETFKILMGSETYRSLQQCAEFVSGEMPEVIARLYSLKHQNEHETGWEFDPFSSHPELYETAKEVVRRASGMQSEFRTIEPASTVRLKINDKISGQLISLGSEHMRISSQEYFCKKVHLTIEFCPDSQEMSERLFHLGMTTLYVHVISGAPAPDGCFHHDVKTHPFESSEYSELKTLLSGQH